MKKEIADLVKGRLYKVTASDCCAYTEFTARFDGIVDPDDDDMPLTAWDNGVKVACRSLKCVEVPDQMR